MGKMESTKKCSYRKKGKLVDRTKVRFKNTPGEQGTFFINDPSNNSLEFKTFKNDGDIFRSSK